MPERGRLPVIRKPEAGVALALCYLARVFPADMGGLKVNSFHPDTCRFCELTDDELNAMLDDFNTWAGVKDDREVPDEVLAFVILSSADQSRLVKEAAKQPG
jgi:hypothetical protein